MKRLLELKPSTPVEIHFINLVHKAVTLRTEYVGCIYKKSILLKMPRLTQEHDQMAMKKGTAVTVRCILDPTKLDFIIFKVPIKAVTHIAPKEPLLILEFPAQVDAKQLRSQARIPTDFIGQLDDQHNKFSALIKDWSTEGCKCEVQFESESKNEESDFSALAERLQGSDVKLSLQLDNLAGKLYQFEAEVRSSVAKEKIHLGLKFPEQALTKAREIYSLLLMEQQGIEINSESL
ncbi:PilZ domain-containing protein [Catenovulum sp. SM1970]|uniref:PilZ domain-containing protein n=1 Tax=Marinifaba aquimaris TaxID=2741323 RepID=UPI001571D8F1|nr:PilZ domain-containing protein [Marinifaba aquimaris]NTS77600.1 PilZ domain-containing protein [Marinifaba aquimaris]